MPNKLALYFVLLICFLFLISYFPTLPPKRFELGEYLFLRHIRPYAPRVASLSIVIPAYNEGETLRETFHRCKEAARKCTDDYEIVMLDDASADDTFAIMRELQSTDPGHVRVERHEKNLGIAATFEDLYATASKDYVFLVSGDGEYPPEALEQAWPMKDAYDVVICHRRNKPYSAYRHFISLLYRYGTALLFSIDLYDPGSIKLVKREIYTLVPATLESVYVEAERIIRAARMGYRIGRIMITQKPRTGSVARGARWTTVGNAGFDMLRLWWTLRILREDRGHRATAKR